MNTLKGKNDERDAIRLQLNRDELVERISQTITEDGEIQVLEGVYMGRFSTPGDKVYSVLKPSLCLIAQGSKVVFLGDSRFQYDPFNYLLTTIELPRISQVVEASRERPYLSLRLELDPNLVGSVMIEAGYKVQKRNSNAESTKVSPLNIELLDALVRLIKLIEQPEEAKVLMPLIKREIVFHLLAGDQGDQLFHLTVAEGSTSSMAWAVEQIRQNFDQALHIEHLAQELGMSVSSFYQHFKSVTAMTPLQFQKRVRLQEARRLMLGEDLDATSAAYRVGYNDAAYFSREYKSVFGVPPMRDVQQLRDIGPIV
ncbi:MAG: helix-turn-helix domain-containing protein [Anaerolineaceae bacterium]|nr:helix-turn-helix domain-containing protein [Anaerolineaceae bacterium]